MYICKAHRTSRAEQMLAIKQRHSQIKINKAVFVILYGILYYIITSACIFVISPPTVSPKKGSQEKSNFGHF